MFYIYLGGESSISSTLIGGYGPVPDAHGWAQTQGAGARILPCVIAAQIGIPETATRNAGPPENT